MKKDVFIILLIVFISCKGNQRSDCEGLKQISKNIPSFEQSTRSLFWNEVLSRSGEGLTDFEIISFSIFEVLDSAYVDLILESGGFNPETGELILGMNVDALPKVLKQHNTLKKIENILNESDLEGDKSRASIKAVITPLREYSASSKNVTANQAAFEFLVMENRLLIEILRRQKKK